MRSRCHILEEEDFCDSLGFLLDMVGLSHDTRTQKEEGSSCQDQGHFWHPAYSSDED
jgi:hypothetical protein